MTRRALEVGASLVIAAGGDGTVRACAEVLAGTDVPLGDRPGRLGQPDSERARPAAAGRRRAAGRFRRPRPADRPGVRRRDDVRRHGRHRPGCRASSARLPAAAKRLAGWPAYAAAAAGHLLAPAGHVQRAARRRNPLVRQARSVAVGNSGALPGGFPIMPDARLDDGMLDVLDPRAGGPARLGQRRLPRAGPQPPRRPAAGAVPGARGRDRCRRRPAPPGGWRVIAPGRSLTVAVRPGALRVRVAA